MPSAAGSQRMPDDEEYQFAPSESSGEDDEDAEEEKEPLSEGEESVKRPKRNARLIEDSDQDIQNGYLERARQAIVDDDEEASPSQGRQLRTRRSRRLAVVDSAEDSEPADDGVAHARQRNARDARASRRSHGNDEPSAQTPIRSRLRRGQEDSPPPTDRRGRLPRQGASQPNNTRRSGRVV